MAYLPTALAACQPLILLFSRCSLPAHDTGCTLFYLSGSGRNWNIMHVYLCGFGTIFLFSPPDAVRVYNPYPAALIF